MTEKPTSGLQEKLIVADRLLLCTSIKHGTYYFEIQLPSLRAYCIDFAQSHSQASVESRFSRKQWKFDEANMWLDTDGQEILDNGNSYRPVTRGYLEADLATVGLSLNEIAAHYYARAFSGNGEVVSLRERKYQFSDV